MRTNLLRELVHDFPTFPFQKRSTFRHDIQAILHIHLQTRSKYIMQKGRNQAIRSHRVRFTFLRTAPPRTGGCLLHSRAVRSASRPPDGSGTISDRMRLAHGSPHGTRGGQIHPWKRHPLSMDLASSFPMCRAATSRPAPSRISTHALRGLTNAHMGLALRSRV